MKEIDFDPLPFLVNPHLQTIVGSQINVHREPASMQKLVYLPDGDRISLQITTPKGWKETDLTVFMIHGLCGSHRSNYLIRLSQKLEAQNIRAIRYNMRGCGTGRGFAKRIYHSGRSEDVFECIKAVKKGHPQSPLLLIGFSLGGNIALKMAGELGHLASAFLKGLIAVSPPVDLYKSIQLFAEPANQFYERYFYRRLRADVYYLHKTFKDLPKVNLPKKLQIYEFDQMYIAPTCGYTNAIDYYNRCSSLYFVEEIAIPTRILLAQDDPLIWHSSLDQSKLPSNIELYKTKHGGHMGYLGIPGSKRGFFWMDTVVLDWVKEMM